MATERIPPPDSNDERIPVAPTRRGYRIGPADMEDFVNLPSEEQRRLADTSGALDAWLIARAATYAQNRA